MKCALILFALLAASCAERAPTYFGDTRDIIDRRCAGCHRAGGIGPGALTSYDEVVAFREPVRAAIESGTMPPWLAADDCNTYSDDFSLSDEERATLLEWLDGEMEEGVERAQPQALSDPSASGVRADLVFDVAEAAYQPAFDDEYRCFVVPWNDASTFLTGFDVLPGDPSNVHHVNVFLNPPDTSPDFVGLDDEDPRPGFSCANGSRTLTAALIGAWAPGASGLVYPANSGQLIETGASITLEVHYAFGGAQALPDLTQLVLQTDDEVERRGLGAALWYFGRWEQGEMPIPAGDDEVTHEVTLNPALSLAVVAPWLQAPGVEIHVAGLHMHQLGKSTEIVVKSAVGDTCLLDIPAWDFNWQRGYTLDEPAILALGEDELYLRCTWDNSAANQPVINGEQLAPVDVNWGSRTRDEMCIGFLYLVPTE